MPVIEKKIGNTGTDADFIRIADTQGQYIPDPNSRFIGPPDLSRQVSSPTFQWPNTIAGNTTGARAFSLTTYTLPDDGWASIRWDLRATTALMANAYLASVLVTRGDIQYLLYRSPLCDFSNPNFGEYAGMFLLLKGDIIRFAVDVWSPSAITTNSSIGGVDFFYPLYVEVPAVFAEDGPRKNYSLDEQDTGRKWIDGKPIYRRVFVGSITIAKSTRYLSTVISSGIDKIINQGGWFTFSNYTNSLPGDELRNCYFRVNKLYGSLTIVALDTNEALTDAPYEMYCEYTKM